jgi:rhodanese-related sulfurtransferase
MIQGRNKMKLTSTFTKRALTIALSAGMILAYAGMTSNSYAAKAKTVKPTKITLKTDYSTIDVKAAAKLSVKSIKPAKASKKLTYKSSNTKVATVSKSGIVTGKKNGTVKITATSAVNKKVKASIKIKVKDVKPTAITLDQQYVSFKGTTKLGYSIGKGVYDNGETWTSADPTVATVDANGTVTAVKDDKVTITVKNNETGLTAECTVTTGMNGISAKEVKSIIDNKTSGWKLLDVRKASDYAAGHADGSILTDMDQSVSDDKALEEIQTAIKGDPAGTKYVVLCYSGNSYARRGYKMLLKAGVSESNIYNLAGGYNALKDMITLVK